MMMTSLMENMWGTTLASVLFLLALARNYLPIHQLEAFLMKHAHDFFSFIYPYIQINVHEYTGERFKRSEAYVAIKAYLAETASQHAKRLKAEVGKDSSNLIFSMDELEEVTDEFKGAKLWWLSTKTVPRSTSISIYPGEGEFCFFKLSFHRRHRELVTKHYMPHVIREGKAAMVRNRQRRLYTNCHSQTWYGYKKTVWNHVVFEHPATFETLAMDPEKKQEIMEDLATFRDSKDYYAKIGKAWKRGYLLHGPPGTGKSTMIAAMANFLDYDVYDVELTAVKDNTELRKLLIETSNKSIMVIEDIDCSLDLSGSRKKKDEEKKEDAEDEEKKKLPPKPNKEDESSSKVTLSGLLNFIDGLWSACGGERIIVFTTNHLDKLDPALIRAGRMDKHIELAYCTFEGFKAFAKNYLGLDSHPLFESVQQQLMQGCKITPADVAEKLMPKKSAAASATDKATACLQNLIQTLQKANEELKSKEAESEAAAAAQLKENDILEKKKDSESNCAVVQSTENGN